MLTKQKISPCLWFDDQAEEAANFYISIFKDSKIVADVAIRRGGQEVHGKSARLGDDRRVRARRAGLHRPEWRPDIQVHRGDFVPDLLRDTEGSGSLLGQALGGRGPKAQQCGWLKDRYGLSWQVVPAR